jgi:hypothetical protein|tara:strand:- start:4467 stop:5168 length:702 start_codon:yes stop_codon:yes gene_type:complete
MNLETIEHDSRIIASLLASGIIIIGAILWFKKKFFPCCLWVWEQFTFKRDMRKWMVSTDKERLAFLEIYAEDSIRHREDAKKNTADIAAIDATLKNGISHKQVELTAQMKLLMESIERPFFLYNEAGQNRVVSAGYLELLGLNTAGDLDDHLWEDFLHGELKGDYLHTFEAAKESKTTFRSTVDFINPYTKEHRGRWGVIAPCESVGKSLIFTGRFDPVDEKAHDIAKKFSWE